MARQAEQREGSSICWKNEAGRARVPVVEPRCGTGAFACRTTYFKVYTAGGERYMTYASTATCRGTSSSSFSVIGGSQFWSAFDW